MTDIAHWPVHADRAGGSTSDIETAFAYMAFALAFALAAAVTVGLV